MTANVVRAIEQHHEKVRGEKMEWKPSLKKGETFLDMGDGSGMICKDTLDGTSVCDRKIEAPMGIRAHILMEGLRGDLSDPSVDEYPVLAGKQDLIKNWHDMRDLYCANEHGAKYADLDGYEQHCK